MKKVILYISLIIPLFSLLFVSCSDDPMDAEANTDAPALTRRSYSDEQLKLQRLGYAFNAAGNVMDDSSFSTKPVINIERVEAAQKEYGLIINSERRHYTSMDIFSGNTLQELGHQETKYTIDDSEAIGSGKYYRKNNTHYQGTWHNSYKAHMFIKHIMATMTIDVGMLHYLIDQQENVFEEGFLKDVQELVKNGEAGVNETNATKFSETYGTHLVVSSNLGGMIELQMEINSDSCVDKVYTTQQVTEIILGKQVTKTSNSKVISEVSKHTVQYHGQIQVKGGNSEDCSKLHRTFDETRAAAVKISDGDYYGWANGISIEPESYNASFVSGRFVAFYELFEDANTRKALRKAYELYLKKEAPTQEVYEPDYGVMPVKGNYGQDVRVASSGANKSCIICEEYVPSIRSDKPCIVAYPLLRGTDGNVRPFLYSGLFVGDESHRPGRVIWEGSSSVYTPSDSIFAESDSTAIRALFDPETHALKNVYFYWNAVHPQPNPTAETSPKAYSTTVFSIQPTELAQPTTFAKVASTFWSVRPVVPKIDGMKQYWEKDSAFYYLKRDRYSDNDGVLYKNGNYCFCLLDGGDNIKRVAERTDDANGNKRWTDAVSQSMKVIGLNKWLPTVVQSQSITKMLGNRMSIFYNRYTKDRNMLGLDWPTGYWVISHPEEKTMATVHTQNDGQGMPIVTNDKEQMCIMRLSGSGTDLLLSFPEYVRSFNYSDQLFFKFFPIYITTDTF
jgi:hypothetical protein